MKIYFCCFILAIVFLLIGTRTAEACYCFPINLTFTNQIEKSAMIFTGKVISIEKSENHAKVIFNVEEKLKGVTSTRIELNTSPLDRCDYYFEIGKSYLVYTSSDDNSGKFTAKQCSRTRPKKNKQARKDLARLRKRFINSKS